MSLTGRGMALLVSAAALWGVGRLLGVAELYVVAAAAAALVGVSAIAVRFGSSTLSVRRATSASRLSHGGSAEVTIDIRNDARWDPAPLLLVKDRCHWTLADEARFVVSGMRPREVVRLSYPVRGLHRGRYTVGPLALRVRDPFGVVQLTREYRSTNDLTVYPRVEALPEGLTRGVHVGSGTSDERRLYNTGDEFHTMREYVQGDDLRLVHWPTTAKQQRLMVRQQELPWQAEATLLLDTRAAVHRGGGPDSTFEKAVSAAASVIAHLARHGYRLRLAVADDHEPPSVEPSLALLDRLAEVEPSAVRSLTVLTALPKGGGQGLLVAIGAPPQGDEPSARAPELQALLHAGRAFASRTAVLVHPRERRDRAVEAAAFLRVAGWRATAVSVDERLADRWPDLLPARSVTTW